MGVCTLSNLSNDSNVLIIVSVLVIGLEYSRVAGVAAFAFGSESNKVLSSPVVIVREVLLSLSDVVGGVNNIIISYGELV